MTDAITAAADFSKRVTVYGASAPSPATYALAEELGAALARHDFVLINGGNTGTMEAGAKGAKEAGGKSVGILVSSLLPYHNPYLTSVVDTKSLVERLDVLTQGKYFVVLPGTLGTLTELCLIWNISALLPAEDRPIILAFRDPWEKCCKDACSTLGIRDEHLHLVQYVDTVSDVISVLTSSSS
eukprot:GILI01026877.1.p1 GENE.GILI01026877.1~~GILI01026877.1.p1  ORF type:complete len:204 (-),score=31.33 GILI01026877.1:47-598(-)